ncbi:DUF58 domain-containing protein [Schlesneria paludicola]|uniref:DUF58 domain-containing protein n=1 Tax=Schlesneria paludicola TaxID=360056 RepID=UPI00029B0879|nr:DUF58 domain-containing protein [Schlesneria paludicola]
MRRDQSIWQGLTAILHYDFCPWANRWLAGLRHPVSNLAFAAIAALACGLFVKSIALLAFVVLTAIVCLGWFWPVISTCGVSCTVRFSERRVTEGERVRIVVQISNRCPWPVWGLVIDPGFAMDAESRSSSVVIHLIHGWSNQEVTWEVIPPSRGEYPLRAPDMATDFPFGLRTTRRPIRRFDKLIVWPSLISLETLLDAAETRPTADAFSDVRTGDRGDVIGTRPFRDGDSLRRVHWVQTARTGKMIVSERQMATQPAIRVVFDSDPQLHDGSDPDGTLEWSIRIAASVCAAYHRENALVECCFGHESIELRGGTLGLARFLDSLAKWKPCHSHHARACQHDHRQAACHRIHHRNCGVFQLTITTDRGVGHRVEHRHVHGEQKRVVLRTRSSEKSCEICGDSHNTPQRHSIILDRSDDIAAEFRRKWRLACHVG